MEESYIEVIRKRIKELEDGSIAHEIEALTTKGIQLVKAHKGFLLCDFIIHNAFSDENGNWDVSAMTTLVDILGNFASYSFTSSPQVTLDFSISFYSTAKVQEEVEIEAKVIGKKDELTSVVVEVKKKQNGELVALAKLWMAVAKRNPGPKASKL